MLDILSPLSHGCCCWDLVHKEQSAMSKGFTDSNSLMPPPIPLKEIKTFFPPHQSVLLLLTFLSSPEDKNIFKVTSNPNLPLSNLWFSFALIETNEPSAINLYASRTELAFIQDTHD